MNILDKAKAFFASKPAPQSAYNGKGGYTTNGKPAAYYDNQPPNVVYRSYNGEKNYGELGTISVYNLDYYSLAARCWQAYTESPVATLIVNDYTRWVVGAGLRLESQPNQVVLNSEGVTVSDKKISDFSQTIEARFNLQANSRFSDYARLSSINGIAREAAKTAALSGDCLIIQRVYQKGGLNIELIDGTRVVQPLYSSTEFKNAANRGNTIQNGIEMNARGGHVAYFVRVRIDANNVTGFETKRIAAKGEKSGRTQAFMVYHSKYRTGYNRGIPMLAAVLEMLSKLDRYIEAAVGSAEERAKIVFQITHEKESTGENPLAAGVMSTLSIAGSGAKNADEELGITTEASSYIASTSEKTTYNMPIGSKLEAIESKMEMNYKEFMESNLDVIIAAVGAPPEVARKKFNSNYSASRMAVKTWQHTIEIARNGFSFQFYKPIYNLQLELDILAGRVSAPGYLDALFGTYNHMILEAYRKCTFLGINVPSVDPLKEANAARTRLGPLGANVPMSTPEQETEQQGFGEYLENSLKFDKQVAKYLPKQPTGNGNI